MFNRTANTRVGLTRFALGIVFALALTTLTASVHAQTATTCPPGQTITPRTSGFCCWPGQRRGRAQAACAGVPTCPEGFTAQGRTCVPASSATSTAGSPGASPASACPPGQSINPDTAGHCCWPSQAWSQLRSACIGAPTCPEGYSLQGDNCLAPAAPVTPAPAAPTAATTTSPAASCPAGQSITSDTAGQCCWPQQVWSVTRSACIGQAACPAGFTPQGEGCIAAPSGCAAGQSITPDTAGHCCWPQQVWSVSRNACIGIPACPAEFAVQGETCVATPAVTAAVAPQQCPAGQMITPLTAGHCCWVQWHWSVRTGACAPAPDCPMGQVLQGDVCVSAAAVQPAATAAAACPPGQVIGPDTAGRCCWPQQVWSASRNTCIGVPVCTDGWVAMGEACVSRPATAMVCAAGEIATPTGCVRSTANAALATPVVPEVIPRVRLSRSGVRIGGGAWRLPTASFNVVGNFSVLSGAETNWGVFFILESGAQIAVTPEILRWGVWAGASLGARFRVADPIDLGARAGVRAVFESTSLPDRTPSIDLIIVGVAGGDVTFWLGGAPRLVLGGDVLFGVGIGGFGYVGVNF